MNRDHTTTETQRVEQREQRVQRIANNEEKQTPGTGQTEYKGDQQ